MERKYIEGTHPRTLPKANRTYGEGRVCEHEGCRTRISIYNKATYCWAHRPQTFPLVRGERRKKAAA